MTRTRGALAHTINHEKLLELGKQAFTPLYPDHDPARLEHGPLPQMLIVVDDLKHAVVNGEGVGKVEQEDGTVEVAFVYGMSVLNLPINVEDALRLASADRIDLADGIRTFGDRLDTNHSIWARRTVA